MRVFGTGGGEVGKRVGKREASGEGARVGFRVVLFVVVVIEGLGLDARAVIVLGERWSGGEVEELESESLGESIMLSRSSSESGCSWSRT